MTIPEYDQECDCEMCVFLRNKRNDEYKKQHIHRVKNEIMRVHHEHNTSTGTDFQEDHIR